MSISDSNATEHPSTPKDNPYHLLDMKLDENARLLVQLRQAQYDRLCQPSTKIHQIISSSQQQQQLNEPLNEYELAEKVLHNLSDMTHLSSNLPERVVSSQAIRHNLGIVINNESADIDTL